MALLEACTEEELQALYEWVDSVPLSRPKRNITRDFADGVLLAEIVHHYFPRLVELHNYSAAHNSVQKMCNWQTLNQKVFKRMGFTLPREQCEAVVGAEPGAVERVLKLVRTRMARFQEAGAGAQRAPSAASDVPPAVGLPAHAPAAQATTDRIAALRIAADVPAKLLQAQVAGGTVAGGGGSGAKVAQAAAFPTLDQALAASLADKEQQLDELRETNQILETKIGKLEQLVRLKDAKIQALLVKLQGAAAQEQQPGSYA